MAQLPTYCILKVQTSVIFPNQTCTRVFTSSLGCPILSTAIRKLQNGPSLIFASN